MIIIRYILLVQALLAIFIAGGLFFKQASLKNSTVALFTGLFGLEILVFLHGTSKLSTIYPEINGWFYFKMGFLYGPLLWIHFKSLVHNQKKLIKKDYLHFIPVLVIFLLIIDTLILPGEERIVYFRNHFYDRLMPINYVRALHLFLYAVVIIYLIVKNKAKISQNTLIYLWALSLIYISSTVIISFYTLFADGWRQFAYYYLANNMMILVIGVILYTDPNFLKEIKKKYLSSNLNLEDMSIIESKIRKLFESERVFLDNQLTVDYLGKQLDIKPYHISQTFSEYIEESFNDFVNRHRISYSKKLLKDPEYDLYKIEAIALESGFNNKVTFYKAFTKFTSITPSKYRFANQ